MWKLPKASFRNGNRKRFCRHCISSKAEYSKSAPALIIELNFNKSASKALEQIKERNYLDKVREYSSKVMMLGISYDAKSKKHECVIENV